MSYFIQYYITDNTSSDCPSTSSVSPAVNHLPTHHFQCTEFFILVWHKKPSEEQTNKVEELLNARCLSDVQNTPAYHFIRAPRQGTISAWASKAGTLLESCHIQGHHRIERLWYYYSPTLAEGTGISSQQHSEPCIKQTIHELALPHIDRMTQQVLTDWQQCEYLFTQSPPKELLHYDISTDEALHNINQLMGLALSDIEIAYLKKLYQKLNRKPTDAELMMFAQVNSEHCRHKIFNAQWHIDGKPMPHTLFAMIRHTYKQSPTGISIAYDDNAAVLTGGDSQLWQCDDENHRYHLQRTTSDIQIKVETHNHPTAISPYPGAATGSGGELRDEAATGRGGIPKAGLVGYTVSHLNMPERPLSFENPSFGKPEHISSSLDIMLQAPIGAARYNNEFGRPCIAGYFRSYQRQVDDTNYGYHKPIMLAGGLGTIRQDNVHKKQISDGSLLIVLGAAAQLIGLGGGSTSSKKDTNSNANLDFSSVQRDNAEVQRRCQEVISRCSYLGEDNPIISIHDVGAGGISNALPELVNDNQQGAIIDLRKTLSDDSSMSPMEIWCNESQERYVLAIAKENLEKFTQICQRERCPMAVVGTSTEHQRLLIKDTLLQQDAVDLPLQDLLGKMPKLTQQDNTQTHSKKPQHPTTSKQPLPQLLKKILTHPTVGDKSFLITIGDRSVGGLIHRDQMVGAKQLPVADCAITSRDYTSYRGEAMSIGERTPIAIHHSAAAARMAVAEAITNMLAAPIDTLSQIKLSCNWMAAAQQPGMGKDLYDAVHTVGMEFCPQLGIAVPVGKDSMSMQTEWTNPDKPSDHKKVISPLSLIVSAFALLPDIRANHTPLLPADNPHHDFWLIDLGLGANRLQHSIADEIINIASQDTLSPYNQVPDIEAQTLLEGFNLLNEIKQQQLLTAYHDRSDGGLWTALCETLFVNNYSFTLEHQEKNAEQLLAWLLNEEIGMLVATPKEHRTTIQAIINRSSLHTHCHYLGSTEAPTTSPQLTLHTTIEKHTFELQDLQTHWSETSYHMKKYRDNPQVIEQEKQSMQQGSATLNPSLNPTLSSLLQSPDYKLSIQNAINHSSTNASPAILNKQAKVAILREQGINGHQEMAFAFYAAGLQPIDVHMSDILNGSKILEECHGLVACGGFSYGDVLGAGTGWAKSILLNPFAYNQFQQFFHRPETFSLGVCNGCQMLSHLKEIIPGAESWSTFTHNQSAQFEARLTQIKITPSPSILLKEMEESILPTIVSHGEGRIDPTQALPKQNIQCAHYVDYQHQPTTSYPANPNGSTQGLTALTTTDGRTTIMMPHPERTFRLSQYSWHPQAWQSYNDISPWMKLFTNAKDFIQ